MYQISRVTRITGTFFLEINKVDKPTVMYRNPRKANWVRYRESLRENLKLVMPTIRNANDIEVVSKTTTRGHYHLISHYLSSSKVFHGKREQLMEQ
jgi:hypothetical protein